MLLLGVISAALTHVVADAATLAKITMADMSNDTMTECPISMTDEVRELRLCCTVQYRTLFSGHSVTASGSSRNVVPRDSRVLQPSGKAHFNCITTSQWAPQEHTSGLWSLDSHAGHRRNVRERTDRRNPMYIYQTLINLVVCRSNGRVLIICSGHPAVVVGHVYYVPLIAAAVEAGKLELTVGRSPS